MSADFERVRRESVPLLPSILPRLFPRGRVIGREFRVGNLAGEPGQSLAINLETGVWSDFATGQKGPDLTSLLAAMLDVSQVDACLLAQTIMDDPSVAETVCAQPVTAPSKPIDVPIYTPETFALPEWGSPFLLHEYRWGDGSLAFVVARYGNSRASKTYRPWVWDGYAWSKTGLPERRPLYRLPQLLAAPQTRPVLVVEGEKCADLAADVLGDRLAVVTWSGGASATGKTDWQPLAGRSVIIWPDADAPGRRAGSDIAERIQGIVADLSIIETGELPPRADIVDIWNDLAGRHGTAETLMSWIESHRRVVPTVPIPSRPAQDWTQELRVTPSGSPKRIVYNVDLIVQHDDYFKDWWIEAWDDHIWIGSRQATDADLYAARAYLSQRWHIEVPEELIRNAILARRPHRNTIVEWLRSLKWDGRSRWLDLAAQVFRDPSDYLVSVLRMLFCGLAARALTPGVKFDHCIIIRGPQGIGKTRFFELLGGDRYVAIYASMMTDAKDVLSAMSSGWVVNIEELFDSRRNIREIKSIITSTTDTWRRPYDRIAQVRPKRCVLVGTTDAELGFLDDPAGYRRFLIINCHCRLQLDWFCSAREALFAEAVHCVTNDPNWWQLDSASRQLAEQIASDLELEDPWMHTFREALVPGVAYSMDQLCAMLSIAVSQQHSGVTRRVARIVRHLGWIKRRGKDGRYWYEYCADG